MQPPKKTLVFHIGDHKTGSTSIQNAFALDKVTLSGKTLFYPGRQAHNYLGSAFNAYSRPKPKAAHEKAVKPITTIARRLRNSDADICLISAEAFERIDPQVFHDIITKYFADITDDIRVVAYVRPHGAHRQLIALAQRLVCSCARTRAHRRWASPALCFACARWAAAGGGSGARPSYAAPHAALFTAVYGRACTVH